MSPTAHSPPFGGASAGPAWRAQRSAMQVGVWDPGFVPRKLRADPCRLVRQVNQILSQGVGTGAHRKVVISVLRDGVCGYLAPPTFKFRKPRASLPQWN